MSASIVVSTLDMDRHPTDRMEFHIARQVYDTIEASERAHMRKSIPDELRAAGLMVPVPAVMPVPSPFVVCAVYITAGLNGTLQRCITL